MKNLEISLTFMNSMEDGRRNPGSRPWTFKTRENPGYRLLPTVNTNTGHKVTHYAHVYCGRQWGGSVCGSWGKGIQLGDRGARPSRMGKGAAVGSRQRRRKGRSNMATGAGDGLATASRDGYTQSECYCALYNNCIV